MEEAHHIFQVIHFITRIEQVMVMQSTIGLERESLFIGLFSSAIL